MSQPSSTRVDKFLKQARNHPIWAKIIIIGICILTIAGFVDSIQKLIIASKTVYSSFFTITQEESQLRKAISVISNYTKLPKNSIRMEDCKWLNLAGSGNQTEFYVSYSFKNSRYISVYSIRINEIQRLYYERESGDEVGITSAIYDGRPFIVVWNRGGSGGWLGFSIFGWDGVGPLQKEFTTPSEEYDAGFFKGELWIINDKVYITGSNQKYELIRENRKFRLQPYSTHPKYGDYGMGCHIFRIREVDNKLAFSFDGKDIPIEKINEDKYISKQKIEVLLGESILIDDYIEGGRAVRIFAYQNEIEWRRGLFPTIVPIKSGDINFEFNDSYGPWYDFILTVTQSDEFKE